MGSNRAHVQDQETFVYSLRGQTLPKFPSSFRSCAYFARLLRAETGGHLDTEECDDDQGIEWDEIDCEILTALDSQPFSFGWDFSGLTHLSRSTVHRHLTH
jgi:hypothetical protein